MRCYKCDHEFCWNCNGDFYRYNHNPGMEKYCIISSSKWILLGFICVLLALKITSLFWDSWTMPQAISS